MIKRQVPLIETTSDQTVIPIINGKVQPKCTFEEYVRLISDSQSPNWSKIND